MKEFVSIVIPIYNEAQNLQELCKDIWDVMGSVNHDYEIILVNDGSDDHSWQIINELCNTHDQIRGIDLAGNYGQTLALRAGVKYAKGTMIIAMDGDMQHDPKYLPAFIKYIEEGYEMAGGAKSKRPENFLKKVMANFAHWIIRKISGVKMKYFGATFKAYRSYLLKNYTLLGDSHRFLGALLARKGVKYIEFPIDINKRKSGKSNYRIKKVFLVILDLIFLKFIISYMNKPFRLFGLWGGVIFIVGFTFTLIIVLSSSFGDIHIRQDYLAEFIFFIMLILVGLFMISIGILAEIGIYNYFSKDNNDPFCIRNLTENLSQDGK